MYTLTTAHLSEINHPPPPTINANTQLHFFAILEVQRDLTAKFQ